MGMLRLTTFLLAFLLPQIAAAETEATAKSPGQAAASQTTKQEDGSMPWWSQTEEYKDFEPLSAYRRRMNITFHYQTKYLSAGHCRYLTEDECQRDDEAHGEYVRYVKQHHRSLNPSLALEGRTFKVLVLLVRFTNHVNVELPSREYFDTLLNGAAGEGPNTIGSIAEYLRIASLNKYRVEFDVQDWRNTSNTEAFFAEQRSGRVGNAKLQNMFTPVLDQLDNLANFDWSQYDMSGGQPDQLQPLGPDRRLDHLLVIHSGYGAELGNKAGGCVPNAVNRIQSQGSGSLGTFNAWRSSTGYSLNGYSVGSAFGRPLCGGVAGGSSSKHAVITHEYLHGFQLQDLYDLDDEEPRYFGGGGVGNFDIMANLAGFQSNFAVMGHMGPYSRYDADWLEYTEITENGIYAIQPSEVSSQVLQIKKGYRDGEYLLIENRQKLLWDESMPNSGIVVWHIDETKARQNERSYPGHPGWPLQHYKVAVLQRDGLFDLEKNVNRGDANDFFSESGMEIGPGPNVQPNTDSYYNGPTNVRIRLLTDSRYIMLLYISGLSNTGNAPDLSGGLVDPTGPLSNNNSTHHSDTETTGTGWVVAWVLSVLSGMALVLGFLAVML